VGYQRRSFSWICLHLQILDCLLRLKTGELAGDAVLTLSKQGPVPAVQQREAIVRQGVHRSQLTLSLFLSVGFAIWATLGETAQAQKLRVNQVQIAADDSFPTAIRFYCAQGYDWKDCKNHIMALRHELARYPVDQLGSWSFVLVSSDSWKDLARSLSIDPSSPAFTVVDRQTTVFEQALFSPIPLRLTELIRKFGLSGDALLQLAVSHELGHALCKEGDEHRVDAYGRYLREGQLPSCRGIKARASRSGTPQ
jgi:hypothetical protein